MQSAPGNSEIVPKLIDFIREELLKGEVGELRADTPLLGIGAFDSLSFIQLLSFIEKSFGQIIPHGEVQPRNFATVNDMANLVRRMHNRHAGPVGKHDRFRQLIGLEESYGIQSRELHLPSGNRFHFLQTKGAEPAWVFLPGLGNPSIYWSAVLRTVNGRQKAVAPDLGGFGLSDYVGNTSPSWDDQVTATLEFLESLQPGKIVLVGSSAGAMIASEICRRQPEMVEALVVTGFGRIANPPQWRDRLRLLSRNPADFLRAAYHVPPRLTPTLSDLLQETLASPAYDSFLDDSALAALPDIFTGIQAPTLFVAGESDDIIPRQAVEDAHAQIPHSQLQWLARCGHFPPAEQSGAFLWYVDEFVNSLRADPPGRIVARSGSAV